LNLCYATIDDLSRLLRGKEISPVEIVKAHLQRIEETEPTLNAFITILGDEALKTALVAEQDILSGLYRGPLHGIPFSLKDLYYTKGIRTTSGIKVYDRFEPDHDSTVGTRLQEAGSILLGKLNLAPLAMRGSGRNEFYGHARNPWNPNMVAGGSSSGAGAAAAAGQCTITLGSDTGGSIRIPASFCGIVGLKPTYGRVSRYGVSPLSWSLDHCGPMARTVMDCAHIMNVISGFDPNDHSSSRIPVPDYTASIAEGIQGLRIGIPKEFYEIPLDPEVKDSSRKAIALLQELGGDVREISWPNFYDVVLMGHIISMVEASAIHSQMIQTRSSDVINVLRAMPRLEAGMFVSAIDYIDALRLRQAYTVASRKLMEDIDIIAGPTMPMPAFPLQLEEVDVDGTPIPVETAVPPYTRPFNHNGFPAITVPCGFSTKGLPIGLQLAGHPHDDATVLRAAYAYEQATEWHHLRPSL